MITTPEIICDLFSFLDKDQIERIQIVNRFWNNVIIRHKNILPLRQFYHLDFGPNEIDFCATKEEKGCRYNEGFSSYRIKFDGTNLIKIEEDVSSRYSQLTVDEVLTNLNDVIFDSFEIYPIYPENCLDDFLNMMKLVTTKTGGRFRGIFGYWEEGRFGSKIKEIFDNYIIVDQLDLCNDSYIREVCANLEIVQLPSTPKEIKLECLYFKENDENEEVLHFTCNGKLNGANRLTIGFWTSDTNYGNFIRQWFELYRTHQNPMSLVGKFELTTYSHFVDIALDAVKKFLNNTQLRVKYSLERFPFSSYRFINQYVKRSCVLHETDSYALVIEMEYGEITDMSSINASDLNQPPCNKMKAISFCVKSLLF